MPGKKPFSILYAEDDDLIREGYCSYLQSIFETVYEARDGREAYQLYKKHLPNILLFDINMPYINGLEVIQKIRTTNKEIKIIVLTAHMEEEKLLQAIPLGLVTYLKKPVKERDLRYVLLHLIYELELQNQKVLKLSNTIYWDTTKNLLFNGLHQVHLTKNEIHLMSILSSKTKLHFSLNDILEEFFQLQQEKDMTENSIRNIIKRLKLKLPQDTIENHYGVGYRLTYF